MNTTFLIVAGAVAMVIVLLALSVWAIGWVEARHEASEPPILGAGPRHLRRQQPRT
jgi:hypothetical protein